MFANDLRSAISTLVLSDQLGHPRESQSICLGYRAKWSIERSEALGRDASAKRVETPPRTQNSFCETKAPLQSFLSCRRLGARSFSQVELKAQSVCDFLN